MFDFYFQNDNARDRLIHFDFSFSRIFHNVFHVREKYGRRWNIMLRRIPGTQTIWICFMIDFYFIQVYFDDSFSWHNGGKLPGLWGGTRDCSGGRISDTCFSTRLMWRALGDGEVYAYVTHNQNPSWDSWCDRYDKSSVENYRHIHCTKTTGIEIGKSSFRFHHHKWHKIRQEVNLGQPGHNGYIKLWVDDHAEVHVTDIIMRDNSGFDIDGIFFSTFYGGGDSGWACPRDTYTYYRNFRLSTDTKTPSSSQLVGWSR